MRFIVGQRRGLFTVFVTERHGITALFAFDVEGLRLFVRSVILDREKTNVVGFGSDKQALNAVFTHHKLKQLLGEMNAAGIIKAFSFWLAALAFDELSIRLIPIGGAVS